MLTSFYKQIFWQQRWLRRFICSSTSINRFVSISSRSEKCLREIFRFEHVDGTYDDALKWFFEFGKIEMVPENEIQKKTDRAKFRQRNCRLDFTTRTNGTKKIQRVPK